MTAVVHLFHLAVEKEDELAFHEAGIHNLTTSHRREEGTLAMYASSFRDLSTEFIVFEVYADENAYQIHRNSPQFQAYVEKVGGKLIKRESFEVEPVFLKEKLSTGEWVGSQHFHLKFAKVETSQEGQEAFEASVLTNMQTSMVKEKGVLAMYAVQDVEKPTVWYFYEVYASPAAYKAHRQTPHFQTYIAETKDLIVEKELLDLVNDVSMTQGKLG